MLLPETPSQNQQELTMSDPRNVSSPVSSTRKISGDIEDAADTGAASRRDFLKSSGGLVAGVAATGMLPATARAQDAELARLQGARRILIKGGIVLSADRQVGDFAQADVLIEDGKIREVRPDIAATGADVAVIDAANRI